MVPPIAQPVGHSPHCSPWLLVRSTAVASTATTSCQGPTGIARRMPGLLWWLQQPPEAVKVKSQPAEAGSTAGSTAAATVGTSEALLEEHHIAELKTTVGISVETAATPYQATASTGMKQVPTETTAGTMLAADTQAQLLQEADS